MTETAIKEICKLSKPVISLIVKFPLEYLGSSRDWFLLLTKASSGSFGFGSSVTNTRWRLFLFRRCILTVDRKEWE
jgi:hypothetical protein